MAICPGRPVAWQGPTIPENVRFRALSANKEGTAATPDQGLTAVLPDEFQFVSVRTATLSFMSRRDRATGTERPCAMP